MFQARVLTVFLLLVFYSCASYQTVLRKDQAGSVVEYRICGNGNPTIIFENGMGANMDCWDQIYPAFTNSNTLFFHNRPGYARSSAPTTPRNGSIIVEELRILLRAASMKPPYVLVGHSAGGLYMQYFARRYPAEVCALVLVDATHPKTMQGPGAWSNWSGFEKWIFYSLTSKTIHEELNELNRTGDEVLALPTYTNGPVVIMNAAAYFTMHSERIDHDNENRKDTARMYPGSSTIWVDSAHDIPRIKPAAVIIGISNALRVLGNNR
ncbi:MAG: alpha/beta hydrolase [Spirochaetota bacterium]